MISTYERKSKSLPLKPYCHFAKEHDFMELTQWANGEGFDVSIDEKTFSLTYGQFQALQVLGNYNET